MQSDISKAHAEGGTIRMYMGSGKRRPEKKKSKKPQIIMLSVLLVMAALNIVARFSPVFSDWYRETVFHFIGNTFSRICGSAAFSIGELILIAMAAIAVLGPVTVIILMIFSPKRKKIFSFALKCIAWTLVVLSVPMTLNCMIMYQCSTIEEKYYDSERGYTVEELGSMCSYYTEKLNVLSAEVERDESGMIHITDMHNRCVSAMHAQSEEIPLLDGYYPQAKPIRSSMLMTQAGIAGVFFPFTLEANYNAQMSTVNMPVTICHEYSHLKGYILEDEAGFISIMATTYSGDKELMYCGYLEAFNYAMNEYYKYAGEEEYSKIASTVLPQVWDDNIFVTEEYLKKIDEEAVLSSETVSNVEEKINDTSLKINGVDDGVKSYNRVVKLLLHEYYSEK